ncbi:MAG: response regulator [Spirochaetaceae bacterium]|nr:MAG: response regulator [Spirochaetaceae bacterium]
MKVLVVDDSVSMRQMVNLILTDAGHSVILASDGVEALEKFNQEIELVITDFNMAKMGGIELVKAIRAGQVNRTVPVIMLTTESESNKKRESMQAGATAWITKPFNRDSMLAMIEKVTRTVRF